MLERRQPAYLGKDCNVEPRNELEMGREVRRLKMILGQAQIIERSLCEKVVWPIGGAAGGEQEVGRPSILVV